MAPSGPVTATRTGVGFPVAASLTRRWTVSMAGGGSAFLPAVVAEDRAERLDRDREQVRAGDPAGRPAAAEVGFEHREPVVAALHRVAHRVRDLAVPVPGEHAVLVPGA